MTDPGELPDNRSSAGHVFAKCQFPGKSAVYILLMNFPFQVTLASNSIMPVKLELLGTDGALICPPVFVTLDTFIMTQSFRDVPDEMPDVGKARNNYNLYGSNSRIFGTGAGGSTGQNE